jgi:hypothetical protein
MGTRAMITIDKKPFVATHWDGYPSELGKDLSRAKTKEAILKQAVKRSINSADKSVLKEANKLAIERIKKMPKNTRAGYEWALKSGKFVDDIKNYDDWAEYEYDYDTKTGTWMVRERDGSWRENRPKAWKKLSKVI